MSEAFDRALVDDDFREGQFLIRSFKHFCQQSWPIADPSVNVQWNWHHDAICSHLEALTLGVLTRLVINVPPRHSKSTIVSVLWPAWVWSRNPKYRWYCASGIETLAHRDALKCRQLIETPWYRKRFPGVKLSPDQGAKYLFELTAGGRRFSTHVGSPPGEGGDGLIFDDLNNTMERGRDEASVANVRDWLENTALGRMNDPQRSIAVNIQQRVHEIDATDLLINKYGWTALILPTEIEERDGKPHRCITRIPADNFSIWNNHLKTVRMVDQALNPDKYPSLPMLSTANSSQDAPGSTIGDKKARKPRKLPKVRIGEDGKPVPRRYVYLRRTSKALKAEAKRRCCSIKQLMKEKAAKLAAKADAAKNAAIQAESGQPATSAVEAGPSA